VQSQLDRIREVDPTLHAFTAVDDSAATRGNPSLATGSLRGVTIAVKDNFATSGLPTEAGSKLFAGNRPEQDANLVACLRRAGAAIVGKTTMYELACGIPESDAATARNPWDVTRSVGGSSSGSAAAVAAGLCVASLASDTAGSTRVPAALCGVAGYRAPRAAMDLSGMIPFSIEHDAGGILTRSVDDLRAVLAALGVARLRLAPAPLLDGIRLGVPTPVALSEASSDVLEAFFAAVDRLRREHGLSVVTLDLPDLDELNPLYGRVIRTEAAAHYAEAACAEPPLIGASTRERIMPLADLPAHDYLASTRRLAELARQFAGVARSADVHLLALPATPLTAPGRTERERVVGSQTVLVQDHLSHFTILASAFDLAAITVPCGLDGAGLPIGVQFADLRLGPDPLLSVAAAIEQPLSPPNIAPKSRSDQWAGDRA
jgi:aspartyl-tRNA(Asn)/glutamyl-tRNA(Gln) amidotransferase subunit A